MYIDADTIILAGAVLGALALIGGYLRKFQKWFDHQAEQDAEIQDLKKKIEKLERHHDDDMETVRDESWHLMKGVLACLKGLQEKGCNGPVTETANELEEFINTKAHDK